MVLLVVLSIPALARKARAANGCTDHWRKAANAGRWLRASRLSPHLQKSDAERRPRGLAECYLSRDPAV